jgi:hypothetical protein
MKMGWRIETAAKALLILWFIIAMYFQYNLGLADNCDFTRSMGWISSGPIGIEPNWPAAGTEDWSRRFANYWLPFWKLEWNLVRPTTSAILLWLPGALLNYLLYSSKVLYLPILSFVPKLFLFSTLLLLFTWIRLDTKYTTILLFSIGVPVTLVLTNTEYLAYFNSFYQESASLVFLVLLIITILRLRQRLSLAYLLFSLTSILLLATAKQSNLYWPLLAIPFVSYICYLKKNIRVRTIILVNVALILLFTSASAFVTKAGYVKYNPYHSLFYGVLSFSNNPTAHLQDIGMDDAAECINTSAWSPVGSACFTKYRSQLSFKNTAIVICKEPIVMLKMMKYALDNMQDVFLDLGKYSYDDPRSRTSPGISNFEKRFWLSTNETIPLNLWAKLKFKFFPTGYVLFFVIIGFIIWFILRLKDTGINQDLALIGLMSTVACVSDMIVAILGDGKADLIKHLFLSNFLFDIAAIAFLNSALLFFLEHNGKKSLKLNFKKS